jgi:hypothetical protein
LLMAVFTGSEVDHTPTKSGIKGQLPRTVEASENCTSFPGTVALWSAVALDGVIPAVIMQVSLDVPPQAAIDAHPSTIENSQGSLRILRTSAPCKYSLHIFEVRANSGPIKVRANKV